MNANHHFQRTFVILLLKVRAATERIPQGRELLKGYAPLLTGLLAAVAVAQEASATLQGLESLVNEYPLGVVSHLLVQIRAFQKVRG